MLGKIVMELCVAFFALGAYSQTQQKSVSVQKPPLVAAVAQTKPKAAALAEKPSMHINDDHVLLSCNFVVKKDMSLAVTFQVLGNFKDMTRDAEKIAGLPVMLSNNLNTFISTMTPAQIGSEKGMEKIRDKAGELLKPFMNIKKVLITNFYLN